LITTFLINLVVQELSEEHRVVGVLYSAGGGGGGEGGGLIFREGADLLVAFTSTIGTFATLVVVVTPQVIIKDKYLN
jgi:hypothetical protein